MSSAEMRYVTDWDVRRAVDGHETEILDRLGIAWRDGNPHTRCPYPDHEDKNPSWRWDDAAARAFCSCSQQGEDIFSVIKKIRNADFASAKVIACELLGRHDLIRKTAGPHPKQDVASLLNLAPENRDDDLPRQYLAFRLGVAPEQVLMPTTAVVGHRSLAYWDTPPQGKGGKPVYVGDWPCVVFEMIDAAAGKRHAHRIYVEPGGQGKANLGARNDGSARDPKKLAPGKGTAGLCIVWRNTETARHEIGAEGPETACAIAFAFAPEILNGDLVVFSAISAAGIAACKPRSTTTHVTIAADRDENVPSDDAGYQAGERAAYTFAKRNHANVAVSIALPGAPGEKIDWLDVLRRDGIEAVRNGIAAAVPWQPDTSVGAKRGSLPAIDADGVADGAGGQKKSQATLMVELAFKAGADLYHSADDAAFLDVNIGGHRETWGVKARFTRDWLIQLYFGATESAPNQDSLSAAMNVLAARARFDGPQRPVSLRTAAHDGNLYVDLCDDRWRALEISADGWKIIDVPPVRFRRRNGMRALPPPVPGGSIESLRGFLNVGKSDHDENFVLAVSWLLAALRPRGPYPILGLIGEQGAAKTTFARVLHELVDSSVPSSKSLPRDERDLFIAAHNHHVLSYDNVSNLADWLSDALCRLATDGGFATRQLYTDDDEVLIDAMRPIALNGIEDFVTRPDLADRALFVKLAKITVVGYFDHAAIFSARS